MGWWGEAAVAIVDALGTLPAVTIEGAGTVVWCHALGGAEELSPARGRAATSCRLRACRRMLPARAARCAPAALPLPSGVLRAIALSFVGHASAPVERRSLLAEIHRALIAGGVLVLLDHNRPRHRVAALAALVRRPLVAGPTPGARWRRLAYPAAREAQAVGFTVQRLRLVAGERVQLVVAAKVEAVAPCESPSPAGR
jgi:SAM-dependent methyltransferase